MEIYGNQAHINAVTIPTIVKEIGIDGVVYTMEFIREAIREKLERSNNDK